jgi:2-haloalkanoic acid dehalogenase type II
MIRGVIFDLGNTLMYFDGDWERVEEAGRARMCAYLNERGYTVPTTFAESFRSLREHGRKVSASSDVEYTAEQALNDALTQHGICWVPEAVLPRAVEKYFDIEAEHWVAYADAASTLDLLKARGLKLALLSNATDHALIERIARNGKLAEFFDPLLSSAKISHRKPDARAFQAILDAWGLDAKQVIMVGDYPSFDILGAHRAGMRGVLIQDRWERSGSTTLAPHGEFADAELMEPDAVIRQLSELPGVIETLNAKELVNA